MTLFLHSFFRSADQVAVDQSMITAPGMSTSGFGKLKNASTPGNSVHVSLWAWVLFGTLVLLALALGPGTPHGKRDEQRRLTLRAAALKKRRLGRSALLFVSVCSRVRQAAG